MEELIVMCAAGIIMAVLYSKTAYPELYAFLNIAAGAGSLILSELAAEGSLAGINTYKAAVSVILGVPGTVSQRLIGMI